MEHLPLKAVNEEYALERACAVCVENALSVVHVEDLPDYVKCGNCSSAFILSEAADWVMYGSVSFDYPETKQMILKRWTTLEAVRSMASAERVQEAQSEDADVSSDTTPPFGFAGKARPSEPAPTPPFGLEASPATAEQATTPPFGIGELDEFVKESANGSSDPTLVATEPHQEAADVSEPEPGRRYVVTLAQKNAILPTDRCAHCLRRPSPRKLIVALGGDPRPNYQVPLCQSCHERAIARSEEQKTARLLAHLSSILIAGVLIVSALAAGLVNLGNLGLVDLLLVATSGMVGYGLPVLLLLRRSSRMAPTEDAQFVRSTLRLRGNEGLGFGWRNRGYAELFLSANSDLLLGELSQVAEEHP